jgi:hypothetical protein
MKYDSYLYGYHERQLFDMSTTFKFLQAMLILWLFAANLAAAQPHNLSPPDTSSPRTTLKSYLDIMGEYGRLLRADIHTKDQASKLRDQNLEDKAERCFDLT